MPACTVEEYSLRNFSAGVDRGSKHAVDFNFSDARDFVSHSRFDVESPTSDMSINHATSILESCCDKNLLLYKERSLGNWS